MLGIFLPSEGNAFDLYLKPALEDNISFMLKDKFSNTAYVCMG